MQGQERHRSVGKACGDAAITFPEPSTAKPPAGALGGHGHHRKWRRFSRRRVIVLLVQLLVCLCVVLMGMMWYWRTQLPLDGAPLSPLPVKPSRVPVEGRPVAKPSTAVPAQNNGNDGHNNNNNNRASVTTTISPDGVTAGTAEQPAEADPRTERPRMFIGNRLNRREEGEYLPEEPNRLPGLYVHRRTYTPAELLERFQNTTYIYSFVNGSEVNFEYRKEVRGGCLKAILDAEAESYQQGRPVFLIPTTKEPTSTTEPGDIHIGQPLNSSVMPILNNPFSVLRCWPSRIGTRVRHAKTLGEVLAAVEKAAPMGVDNRDRETDELRHSLRSVEQHIGWHRGRVVIVSPGHHPTWVDGAKNFLAGVCGDATVQALRSRGTHLRLTTVHQDAVMPYGEKLTSDSHVIEQHIWRVRNITPVHVYMNDDYFVNRDVAITDLFNEYGGTIVRTEIGMLHHGAVADKSASWQQGVLHAQQFNVNELDVQHEDYIPESLISLWMNFNRVGYDVSPTRTLPVVRASNTDDAVKIGRAFPAEALPTEPLKPRRPRHYATHAPFVYCTNMFRFFSIRYEREFADTSLHHRSRMARDLFIPFLYNAFIMARPWQASPQFLPYLLQLHHSRKLTNTQMTPELDISLDNFDGCAPATLLSGAPTSECTYGKFLNNLTLNEMVMRQIKASNPLYFNINAGFTSAEAADQLRKFLHEKFPTPMYLERASAPTVTADLAEADGGGEEEGTTTTTAAANAVVDAALTTLFDSLMALPVVGVVSHEEGACPLVRSLSLAFAGHHRGRVHVAVQRSNDGAEAETLRETRNRLGHRIVSAAPVLQCAFSSRVVVEASAMAESVADVARRVLAESDGAGVVLPSTCGGGFAGLRVRGFVVDARSPGVPLRGVADLPSVLAMPGQTLALEDFRAVRVGAEDGDVVLVLAREDATAKAVHWITGASENDLLLTFPLPVEAYEDLNAPVKWSQP